jgi:hypothetical protein
MNKFALVRKIVDMEWEMFDVVENIGGRASCQDDERIFYIMRESQFGAWDEATLKSYLLDLQEAKIGGRNLLAEKYARMMEHTSPEEYAEIESSLPEVSGRALELVGQIVDIQLAWMKELREEIPELDQGGRPLYSKEDSLYETSYETYLRGELLTYSTETLESYAKHVMKLKAEGGNMDRDVTLRQFQLNEER